MSSDFFANRRLLLLEILGSQAVDVLLSERSADIHYFSGCPPLRGALLLLYATSSPILVVPSYSFQEATETVRGIDVLALAPGEIPADRLAHLVPKGGRFLACSVSLRIRSELEHLGRILPVDTEQLLFAVQRTKTSDEIDKISEAVRIAETGVVAARKIWGVAVKELDIAAEADYAMRKAGSEGQWFATHVATGRRSVYPDAAPTRRLLKSGELGFIDLGPLYDHYAGDLTRSFVVGKHSRGQIELLALVKMALDNAVKMARVGIAAIDLYNSVGAIFCASGKRGYFPHHLGHGLGLFGSCPPVIDAGSQDILKSGDVFTLEPGLYVPGIGGCRMEDVFLMTDDGCKPISTLEHSWSIN